MSNHNYIDRVYHDLEERFSHEKEYLQAVKAFFEAIRPVVEADPEIEELSILERIVTPERIISFRVPWVDDQGRIQVNHGYRVQHSSLAGPYKGGIRFSSTVNQSILKFLAFEQTFKNSLTGLPIGGAKGGADFDPLGKSDQEIMRFCQSFTTELSKYISENNDVPAGDIGVGHREIGFMMGQYKRLKGVELGMFTGKPVVANGSLGRSEATGFGTVYFLLEVLKEDNESIRGKKIIVSGAGNVAYHAALKAIEKGGEVVAMSNITGSVYDPEGIDLETIKLVNADPKQDMAIYLQHRPNAQHSTESVWEREIEADIALPCATQNEITLEMAENMAKNGIRYVVEGANMPTYNEAVEYFINNGITYAPGKAANAGGVAVSSLEMSQNALRLPWSFEEVDEKLQMIMHKIFKQCLETCEEYGLGHDYAAGADIFSFKNIVELIKIHGVI